MKQITLSVIAFLVIGVLHGHCQKLERGDSDKISDILPEILGEKKTFKNSEFIADILQVRSKDLMSTPANPGHELFDMLYISMSEYDEYPTVKIYKITHICCVENLRISEKDKSTALLQFTSLKKEYTYLLDGKGLSVKRVN